MSDPAEESSRSSLERADEIMREADDQNLLDEARRAEMLKKIASYRWLLASTHHRLDTGDHLDFERFFYQKEIYQCPSGDMVVLGSTGNGKSEYLLTSAFAMSILGLKVGYIVDTSQKRNDLTLGRVDPVIHSVPLYAGLLKGAQADRNAEVDSARIKHFGDGSILFIGSNSESDFYSAIARRYRSWTSTSYATRTISRGCSAVALGACWRFSIHLRQSEISTAPARIRISTGIG
jgi:hypothetical protein